MVRIILETIDEDGSEKYLTYETPKEIVSWVKLLDKFVDLLNGAGYIVNKREITIKDEYTLMDYIEY